MKSPGPEPSEHAHEHPHSHGHSHGHGHTHGEDSAEHAHAHSHHDHAPIPTPNAPLPAAAGSGKLLFLDTPSGIAGDMTVAALLDLGVPLSTVAGALAPLGLSGFSVDQIPARTGAIGGVRFVVRVERAQPQRSYAAIERLLEGAELEPDVRSLARAIFRRLAEAESEVHRVPIETVHFHEVGAVDSIVDIVGAAACFVHLGARVVATPLPLGRGTVTCQHGELSLPAPATVLCLRGVPTYPAGIPGELVTPTGAAIVATVAEAFTEWPAIVPERVGVGVGTRRLPDRPNAVRAVLGSVPAERPAYAASHVVLEANVDDMTGELAAHALEALLAAGALDAWATPVTMKKGRPGLVLAALCERARADALASVLLAETSSIGVRRLEVTRTERPRRVQVVETPFGSVPLKISEGAYGPPQVKPEFDVCVERAHAAGVPVREVIAAALAAYRS